MQLKLMDKYKTVGLFSSIWDTKMYQVSHHVPDFCLITEGIN